MQCNWFIQVRGIDSNTGKEVDEWGCSIAWLPHLLIENSNQTRQSGAAIESFRNEMVKSSDRTLQALLTLPMENETKEVKVISYENNDNQG